MQWLNYVAEYPFSSRAQKELQTKLKIWNGHSGENDKEKQKKNH
jgi:hypothetical protein